jgi:hypothetical protein
MTQGAKIKPGILYSIDIDAFDDAQTISIRIHKHIACPLPDIAITFPIFEWKGREADFRKAEYRVRRAAAILVYNKRRILLEGHTGGPDYNSVAPFCATPHGLARISMHLREQDACLGSQLAFA